MQLGRESILRLYRFLTQPMRNRLKRQLTSSATWPAGVLFYHRVADTDVNAWAISRHDFARHLEWLSANAKVVSLASIQSSQQEKSRKELHVALTFDDGYSESVQNALPLIVDRGWPCTFFVSSHFLETGLPFPHDISRGYAHAPNSIDQVKWMAARGIEIGCHTHTHANLGYGLSKATLRREIVDSRKKLQDLSGQPVRYFAFPYGMPENMSADAIDTVYEAGFDGFASAYGDWNFVGDDSYHIRRIHGNQGLQSIANWLSLDPRKFRRKLHMAYLPKNLKGQKQQPFAVFPAMDVSVQPETTQRVG